MVNLLNLTNHLQIITNCNLLEDMFAEAIKLIEDNVKFDEIVFFEYFEEENIFKPISTKGLEKDLVNKILFNKNDLIPDIIFNKNHLLNFDISLKNYNSPFANTKNQVFIPLLLKNHIRGILYLGKNENNFNDNEMLFLQFVSNIISLILENQYLTKRIRESDIFDETGLLYNEHYFKEKYIETISTAKRLNKNIVGVLLKIKNFSFLENNYSHSELEKIIKKIGEIIKKNTRHFDFASRLHKDTFILIFPFTSYDASEKILFRLDEKIYNISEEYSFDYELIKKSLSEDEIYFTLEEAVKILES